MKKNILVAGIGNEYRSDDKAGKIICDLIKDAINGTPLEVLIDFKKLSGEGAELIENWQGYHNVFITDASQSVNEPGRIRRIDTSKTPLEPDFFHYSSHNFSLAEAVELARHINMLPQNLVIYAVEGKNFSSGEDMTFEVEVSCLKAARKILEEISFINSGIRENLKLVIE